MKINGSTIMRTITKSAGHPFDLFDFAVDRLSQSVGDAMTRIGKDVVYMCLNRLSRLLDGLKSRMSRPEIPTLEMVSHRGLIPIIPQMPPIPLDCPRPTYLQVFGSQCLKPPPAPQRNILCPPQPQIPGTLQSLLSTLRKLTMFALSDLVHRCQNMFHHVKSIKNDLLCRVRHIRLGCRNIGIPHVHCHSLNTRQFLFGELLVIALKTFLTTIIPYKLNSAGINVVYQRLIFVSLGYRLFIHSDADGDPVLLARSATINRPLQCVPSPVPAQSTKPRRCLDAALLSHADYQALKCIRHIRAVFTHLRVDLLYPMYRAVYPRWPHMNICLHLAGVQMPIHALWSMIVYPIKRTTLRASDPDVPLMIHINIDTLRRFVHNHLIHKPRQLDSQYPRKKSFLVHEQ